MLWFYCTRKYGKLPIISTKGRLATKKRWKSGPGRLTMDGDAFEKTGLEQITFGSATNHSNRYVNFDIP